jgi:hypothetical protein
MLQLQGGYRNLYQYDLYGGGLYSGGLFGGGLYSGLYGGLNTTGLLRGY